MWKRSGSKCVSCFLLELEKTPEKFNIDTLKMAHIWGRRYMNSIRPIILGSKMPFSFHGCMFFLECNKGCSTNTVVDPDLRSRKAMVEQNPDRQTGEELQWSPKMVSKVNKDHVIKLPEINNLDFFNRNKINRTISPKKKHQEIHGFSPYTWKAFGLQDTGIWMHWYTSKICSMSPAVRCFRLPMRFSRSGGLVSYASPGP